LEDALEEHERDELDIRMDSLEAKMCRG